jgi:hypothetical protein
MTERKPRTGSENEPSVALSISQWSTTRGPDRWAHDAEDELNHEHNPGLLRVQEGGGDIGQGVLVKPGQLVPRERGNKLLHVRGIVLYLGQKRAKSRALKEFDTLGYGIATRRFPINGIRVKGTGIGGLTEQPQKRLSPFCSLGGRPVG